MYSLSNAFERIKEFMVIYCVRYIVVYTCLSLLFLANTSDCAVVISTLSHRVSDTFFNMATGALTCGSKKSGVGDSALMRSWGAGLQLVPIAPEKVTLNEVADSTNPLFDKEIMHVSAMITPDTFGRPGVERILAVTAQEPYGMMMVDMSANQEGKFVRAIDELNDATGKKTAGIVTVEGTNGPLNGVFAAVKPYEGVFGDQGSGIVLIEFGSREIEKDKKKSTEFHFKQLNLSHDKNIVAAHPINISTPEAAINHDLSQIGQHVALHWNATLKRLFVGLDVTAGSGNDDGACALLVGAFGMHTCPADDTGKSYSHRSLNLEPCIAHTLVHDTSAAIIATRGSGSRAAVHHITTFKTSTDIWYVAIVGGCGNPEKSKSTVFAFPLNVNVDENEGGTLAQAGQQPELHFGSQEYPTFRSRLLPTKAHTLDHASSGQNRCVCVGGGPLLAGPIATIITARDAIFAIVAGEEQYAGVYHSQALLDNKGLIKGWTQWRQVYRSDDKALQSAFYDTLGGSFTLLADSGEQNKPTVIKKTVWGAGDESKLGNFVSFLKNQYTKDNTGIRAYADIPMNTKGFVDQSCMVVGGYHAMTVAIMSQRDGLGTMHYTLGQDFTQANAPVMHYKGSTLTKLGTIEAITSASTDTAAWLFVGGTGGLAVYADADGTGWDPYENLTIEAMRKKICLPIGSYSFIRKLIHDEHYLYVLTDDKLDRIDLTRSNFEPNRTHLATTTLATRSSFARLQPFGFFTDAVISDKVAFLATSAGLYRVGNDADIRQATSHAQVAWTQVDIGSDIDPIVHLSAVSTTGRSTDVARYAGGNLYVVQGYAGRNHGTVKRFSIDHSCQKAVDDAVITIIPDIRIKNAPTMFRRIGYFARQCVTDGALWLYIRRMPQQDFSSLCSMNDLYPMHDTQLLLHHTQESNFLFVQRFESSQGAWWGLGQSVVINE